MSAIAARMRAYEAADEELRNDHETYCRNLVKVSTKEAGPPVPLIWKPAQRRLHDRAERQLDARGLVRIIVLKGRQMGISTYIGARYYRRSTLWLGNNVFILTHEDKATQNLFKMVKRMHDHMPVDYRPETEHANSNELSFAGYDASYRIGTAGAKETGRSMNFQLFHGSEVAFWPRAEDHFAASLQAVGLSSGTEIFLESTANGPEGAFYEQWGLAERGQSDFIAVFLPWFIDPDYRRPFDHEFEFSRDEREYQRLYGLTTEQMCWAHFKNIELGGKPDKFGQKFKQEYPATAAEAFEASAAQSLISDEYVRAARNNRTIGDEQRALPRVLGVDVARSNRDVRDEKTGKELKRDATRIVDRQGRRMGVIDEEWHSDDPVYLANKVARHLKANPNIRKAYIDSTEGMGAAIVSLLRGMGYEQRVEGVNFGSSAQDDMLYPNRRCEMHARMRDWFKDPGGCRVPDSDVAQKHLVATRYKHNGNSQLVLEPKEKVKARIGVSPDWADAGALTFADELPIEVPDDRPKWMREHDGDVDEPSYSY